MLIAEVEGGDANKFRLLCSGWPTASWSSLRRAWCSRRTTSVPSLRGVWGCTDGQVFFDFFFSRQCSLWWEIFHHIRFFCQILRVLQTKRFLFPSPFFLSLIARPNWARQRFKGILYKHDYHHSSTIGHFSTTNRIQFLFVDDRSALRSWWPAVVGISWFSKSAFLSHHGLPVSKHLANFSAPTSW